jgi:hypothetical protein
MEGHDFDVEVEVHGDQAIALAAVVDALPNHVWYRWRDLGTGENGRNQDVFPAADEDWDEVGGVEVYDGTDLTRELWFSDGPLFKNK